VSKDTNIKEKIFEFVKNRSEINETTAIRHIHRRFDMAEDEIEKILEELFGENKINKIYDDEFQENRFGIYK